MKIHVKFLLLCGTLLALCPAARAQGTAFTYQGRLNAGAVPASGSYDLTFTLYNTNASGVAVAGPVTNNATVVSNGLFTTTVDFGTGVFTGMSNWLEIAVSTNGANSFTTLLPRQQLTPVPSAITAAGLSGVVENNVPPAGQSGTIGGGQGNVNDGDYATIGGGQDNTNQANQSFIGGGQSNLVQITADYTTIAGGQVNTIQSNATGSFIGGGYLNNIAAGVTRGSIVGGRQNTIQLGSSDSTIGGGSLNTIQTNFEWATISGGENNTILTYGRGLTNAYTTISGGFANKNGGGASVIAGGEYNSILNEADDSVIGGGDNNLIVGSLLERVYSTISGGIANQIQTNATYATIGGGGDNQIQPNATYAIIGGGIHNQIQTNATYATIGGGGYNQIQTNASLSTIAGGYYNQIQTDASESIVAGGGQNVIQTNAYVSTIGGGYQNTIQPNAQGATIAGGYQNVIQPNANFSTIPGGYSNVVAGNCSFAAGQQAHALHQGAFVWADSQAAAFASTRNDQFNIRAAGGVVMSISGSSGLNPAAVTINSTSGNGIGLLINENSSDTAALFANGGTGDIIKGFSGIGNTVFEVFNNGAVTCNGKLTCQSLTQTSDRNAKEHFQTVDAQTVLKKVASLPMSKWNYKTDGKDVQHIGPMAQDFHAAFDLNGADDKHISVVDEEGVTLAAIQGLNQKVEEKDSEIQTLKQQNDSLAERLDELEAAVKSLAQRK